MTETFSGTSSSSSSSSTTAGSSAASYTTSATTKRSDKQFDGAAFLSTLAMAVLELGITLSASYLFSKWIAKLMVNHKRTGGGGGDDDAISGLDLPEHHDSGGSSSGVVTKLKRLLENRQESTLSAMMEELEEEHDFHHNNDSDNDESRQQEEKKEEHSNYGTCCHEEDIVGERIIDIDQDDSEVKDKQRQYHIQRLQRELQSRHTSSLQSLNYITPYELSIARNNLVDPADIAVSFGDVGGMDDIKSEIYDLVVLPLLRPDLFDCESGLVSPPKGILLYGPPGTGKTMLAKAIAKESHATFINVQLSTIMNKWFGESNKLIAATFNLARKLAPSVVFIDEIDAFLSQRDGTEGSAMSSMKSEFLTLWDGLLSERGRGGVVVGDKAVTEEDEDDGRHRRRGFSFFGRHEGDIENEDDYSAPIEDNSPLLPTPPVIILGATNRPYDVDPAILRRLPRSFEIPLPPLQSRLQLLRLFLEKQNMTKEAKEYLPELAKRTEGYSGSDLKEVCRAAAWEPVREMTTGASRRAVGINGDIMSSTNGGSRNSTPLLKRSSSGFPPRGAKARPVNVNDFTLALQKVKRTGESARQFHAKEFVRGREDRASMAADISRATTANGKSKSATAKNGSRNGTHSQNGNGVPINEMANIDIHQLMAMAMAAASSTKPGYKNSDQSEDDEDNPPEMSKSMDS